MVEILKGEVKAMYIDKLEVNPNALKDIKKKYKEKVVRKDSEFYVNFVGREINFEFDNYLCTRMEAQSYLNEGMCSSVLFVDYETLKHKKNVTKKELKEMKKEYKKKK